MKNITKRLLTTLVIFALVFTCFPAFTGSLEADAATKPEKVTKLEAKYSTTKATITWKKLTKNVTGYTIYRNGKAIKSVGKKVSKYTDKTLEKNKNYTYYIKAYRTIKQKQWYNKKTGEWQAKKPAAADRGKSRKAKVKLYGAASEKLLITTDINNTAVSGSSFGYIVATKRTDNSVTFTLSEIEGNPKVKITRGGKLIDTLSKSNLSCTDKNLKAETQYTYKFQTYVKGKLKKTETDKITTTAKPKPKFKCFRLKWDAEKDAVKYELTRKIGGVEDKVIEVDGSKTSYDDLDVKPNTNYTYSGRVCFSDDSWRPITVQGPETIYED